MSRLILIIKLTKEYDEATDKGGWVYEEYYKADKA